MEKLRVYLCCSAVLICVFLFGGLIYTAFDDEPTLTAAADYTDTPTIIIDAGHGGVDGGATDNGLLEKDINLSIALKLRDLLTADGYKIVMTRETDVSIHDPSASTIREKKNSDLKRRVEIINSDDNNILISIHQNRFEQSTYSGTQMFYSYNNENSILLAEEMRKSIVNFLQPENKRGLKKSDDSIYLLKKAKVPAVIIECGFLSNVEEAQKLASEDYQQKMAFSIYCGIVGYNNLNSRDKNAEG